MKKPRVVRTSELAVEERAPPAPPQWRIVESYPELEGRHEAKPAHHAEAKKPAGIFAGVGKWISGLFGK